MRLLTLLLAVEARAEEVRGKRQITVFGEVVNVLGRRNARFDELRGFDANGGARLGFEQTFPLLPTDEVAVDF